MTFEELLIKKIAIKSRHSKELMELDYEFAISNNNVKLGDIIESAGFRIQVDSIGTFTSLDSTPKCRYSGFMITKEGKQRKDQRRETIYQNESIKIL